MPHGTCTPPTPPSRSPPPAVIEKGEASEMLCDAMRCRLEDGDASAENWKDSNGISLAPDRFWNSSMALMITADNAGPCLGIGLNIWERAKVGIHFSFICFISIISIICIIPFNYNVLYRYDGISCTHWWVAEASMEVLMPLITAAAII